VDTSLLLPKNLIALAGYSRCVQITPTLKMLKRLQAAGISLASPTVFTVMKPRHFQFTLATYHLPKFVSR
jgi:hypothetical protein